MLVRVAARDLSATEWAVQEWRVSTQVCSALQTLRKKTCARAGEERKMQWLGRLASQQRAHAKQVIRQGDYQRSMCRQGIHSVGRREVGGWDNGWVGAYAGGWVGGWVSMPPSKQVIAAAGLRRDATTKLAGAPTAAARGRGAGPSI